MSLLNFQINKLFDVDTPLITATENKSYKPWIILNFFLRDKALV